ncbi:TPA: hypothetical protein J8Y49_002366 [Enterococcus faecium]|nr:hypothetical protein [Enterococcus faecium]
MVPKFRAWYTPFKGKKFGQEMIHGRAGSLISHAEMSPDNYVLMQSTGLKDKNGVEIFEGDLVKVSVDNGFDYLFEELSIVKPSKFHSGLVCSLKSHEAEYRIIHAEILGYEYEVVGNIYENPELLEQDNA